MVRARKTPPDGRGNSGGARQGTPGRVYPQRADLRAQKISVPPSAEYGQGERLRRSQQVVPMAGAPAVPSPAVGAGPAAPSAGGTGGAAPSPDFFRATERPDEPLTHGLASGPGAGSDVLRRNASMTDPLAIQLRALYQRFPSQELADLLMDLG